MFFLSNDLLLMFWVSIKEMLYQMSLLYGWSQKYSWCVLITHRGQRKICPAKPLCVDKPLSWLRNVKPWICSRLCTPNPLTVIQKKKKTEPLSKLDVCA